MRVVNSTLFFYSSGGKEPFFANRTRQWATRQGLLLKLEDDAGRIGLGEAAPLPGFSPDTLEDCVEALRNIHTRLPQLDVDQRVDVSISYALHSASFQQTPAAQFALETALLDLIGQRRGCCVAECLAHGEVQKCIELSGVIPTSPPETWAAQLQALIGRGLRTIKVKVGAKEIPFEQEIKALEALLRATKVPIMLRLDANGAWTLSEALEKLKACAYLKPEFVEDPVHEKALVHLGRCAVPWAADQALAFPELVQPLLDESKCSVFVIKPALVGGLLVGRKLALAAQARGLGVVITHLVDGPIALAAACELALSLPEPPLACGLFPHHGLTTWPGIQLPQLVQPGLITPSGLKGLGIKNSEAWLQPTHTTISDATAPWILKLYRPRSN